MEYDAYGSARHQYPEDMDGDGDVDANDQTIFNASYNGPFSPYTIGHASYNVDADFDRDGDVDLGDNVRFKNANPTSALAKGQISDPAGADNVIGCDGYVFNGVQDLYTVRFRTYQPGTGRWLERDPIESLSGSTNYYEYSLSAPFHFDPFGLKPKTKGAHPIPFAIGGGRGQVCFPMTKAQHTASHKCLAAGLNDGVENGPRWQRRLRI